jgi:hypothetical protein
VTGFAIFVISGALPILAIRSAVLLHALKAVHVTRAKLSIVKDLREWIMDLRFPFVV